MSAASTAICAVVRSRISPISTTSGSERRIAGSTAAKVSPALWFTCTWLTPGSRYSTGSSTVMMLTSGLLISASVAYSVVDLPEPVGPVTSTMPCGLVNEVAKRSSLCSVKPSLLSSRSMPPVSSTRSTIFSPHTVGSVAVRRSTVRSIDRTVIRPFCGTRLSVMSTLDMIFSRRDQRRHARALGTVSTSCSTPSMR